MPWNTKSDFVVFPTAHIRWKLFQRSSVGFVLPGGSPLRSSSVKPSQPTASFGAAYPSSSHRRADEIPLSRRLDRHRRNRPLLADVPKLWFGDDSLSRSGNRGAGRIFRERSRLLPTSTASWQTENSLRDITQLSVGISATETSHFGRSRANNEMAELFAYWEGPDSKICC
jgi:hypothetical protein